MISWKRIHHWMSKALEEPFFRAEMRRVEMTLPEHKAPCLHLVEGGGKRRGGKDSTGIKGIEEFAARN